MGFTHERSAPAGRSRYVATYRDLRGQQRSAGTVRNGPRAERASDPLPGHEPHQAPAASSSILTHPQPFGHPHNLQDQSRPGRVRAARQSELLRH
jgi:hypothetical protein